MRPVAKLLTLTMSALAGGLFCAAPARAGAFLQTEGYGQFIAGVGLSEGSRRFDNSARPMPTPAYRKAVASGYLEYGLAPNLTLIAAPTLAREGAAANTVTGSDSSAFGARLGLFRAPGRALSLQVLVQPPLAPGDRSQQLAISGARNLAVDVRLMFAQSFTLFGAPAFVDVAPGVRARADPFPSEARLDVTLGLRPVPQLLLLLQSFGSLAPSAGSAPGGGPLVARTGYDKLQLSLVYDLAPAWSVQIGAFRTVTGFNSVRETGPIFALWYRW